MMKDVMTYAYRLGLVVLFISQLGGMADAEGIMIPASAVEAPVGHHIGNGLYGEFYKPRIKVDSSKVAEHVVATRDPVVTFRSTLVDYPNGNRDTMSSDSRLSTYLGRDSSDLRGDGRLNLYNSVLRFYGYLLITEDMDTYRDNDTIDVWFAVGSDDGCRLRVGGQIVLEWTGMRPFEFVSEVASFFVEGWYKIELICFEHLGRTGIEFYSSIPGGPDSGAPYAYAYEYAYESAYPHAGIVPTEVLSKKLAGIGGKLRGMEVTNRQCWNLSTNQVVQVVETHYGHWACGPSFEWEPGDLVQVITIGPGS